MILVFSTERFEESTEQVLDWLDHLGHEYLRVNGEDISAMAFELDPCAPQSSWLQVSGQHIKIQDVKAIWYRRTGQRPFDQVLPLKSMHTRLHLAQHMLSEMQSLKGSIYAQLDQASWLSHPDYASPNKFEMLQAAHRLGITIPPTKIVSRQSSLKALRHQWGPLIVKCLSDIRMLQVGDKLFNQYTASPDAILDTMPEVIFPTLVQARIEKAYEVRTVFFEGECFSMAMFSQSNAQTKTDFRIYDYQRPARSVPYRLPDSLSQKVKGLMQHFHLDSGAIDFIVAEDGAHYFLEINPVGQFGMVSHPCNYQLEKKMAQQLGKERVA